MRIHMKKEGILEFIWDLTLLICGYWGFKEWIRNECMCETFGLNSLLNRIWNFIKLKEKWVLIMGLAMEERS